MADPTLSDLRALCGPEGQVVVDGECMPWGERWRIEWCVDYGESGMSDPRVVTGPTFAEALALAIEVAREEASRGLAGVPR